MAKPFGSLQKTIKQKSYKRYFKLHLLPLNKNSKPFLHLQENRFDGQAAVLFFRPIFAWFVESTRLTP